MRHARAMQSARADAEVRRGAHAADRARMQTRRPVALVLRAAALPLALALAACASGPAARPAASATTPRTADATRASRVWRDRLVTPGDDSGREVRDYGPFEVDGRRLLLRCHPVRTHSVSPDGRSAALAPVEYPGAPGGDVLTPFDGQPWALVDAESGAEVLPLDYQFIVPVPGEVVYVLPAAERLRTRPSVTRGAPAEVARWKTLDLRSGALLDSDVAYAGGLRPSRARLSYERDFDPLSDAVLLQRIAPRGADGDARSSVEVIPPPGSVASRTALARVPGSALRPRGEHAGDFVVFNALDAEGAPETHLLLNDGTPWAVHPGTARAFRTEWAPFDAERGLLDEAEREFLALHAPGTGELDDLWWILDERGVFGAPAGALGFRPLDVSTRTAGQPTSKAHRWLMRLAEPDARGCRWELRGPHFSELKGETRCMDAQTFAGSYWDDDARVVQRDFLALQYGPERWSAYRLPHLPRADGESGEVYATASSLANLVTRVEVLARRDQEWHAERLARLEEERRAALERAWQAALARSAWDRANELAAQRGGDSYVLLALAIDRPSAWLLERALADASPEQRPAVVTKRDTALARYANEAAETARRRAEVERQIAAYAQSRSVAPARASGSIFSSTSGRKDWVDTLSPAARRAWDRRGSYSQHKVNMGWYPYGYSR